jgi:hypothetical protein
MRAASVRLVLRRVALAAALGALLSASGAADAQLSGAMAAYAWFPGRWSCQTTVASSGTTTPGSLSVLVDAVHDALSQRFTTTLAGQPYRSDEILAYDRHKHAYVQKEVDRNGTQILLYSPGAYEASMTYEGFMIPITGKLYRMRATIGVDTTGSQLRTSTAFWQASTKNWSVQSTGECVKSH